MKNDTIKFKRLKEKYGCFSNFSAHPVEIGNHIFPTTEHFFQAMKVVEDSELFNRVAHAPSPKESKNIAHENKHKWIENWDAIKYKIMKMAITEKVKQHPDIKELLLSTENKMIVEDSDYDYIWGCGKDGTGQNLLGKIWMEVREEIRNNESPITKYMD